MYDDGDGDLRTRLMISFIQYTELPTEQEYDDSRMAPVPVHPAWPTTGNIEFRHYTTNLLHNVSLSIQSGETISIIGDDKHTFAQSLFQMEGTPPLSGSMHVDGVDITHLDVYHLRSRIAWVGSEDENAFFSGTIRENLVSQFLCYQYGVNYCLYIIIGSVRILWKSYTMGCIGICATGDPRRMGCTH